MQVLQNDGFRPAPPFGDEFHQRLIVASRVEIDIHVFGRVGFDEK